MAVSPTKKRVKVTLSKSLITQLEKLALERHLSLSMLLAEMIQDEAARRGVQLPAHKDTYFVSRTLTTEY